MSEEFTIRKLGYAGAFERAQEMSDHELNDAFDHLFLPNLDKKVKNLTEFSIRIPEGAEFPCKDEGLFGKVTGIRNDYLSSDETPDAYLERMSKALGSDVVKNLETVRIENGGVVLLFDYTGSTYQRERKDPGKPANITGMIMEYSGFNPERTFDPKYDNKVDKPDLVRIVK